MRTFIDLFCGCGGLTEGFKRAGWTPLCGVDVSYRAAQSYLANHGATAEAIIGSISDPLIRKQIVHTYANRVRAVVGGPPCQGYSAANFTKSEDDVRRQLPLVFFEVACDLAPDYIVMEEVPAAKSHAPIWIAALNARGYNARWAVLKAEHYGVPQLRRLMVLVAAKDTLAPPMSLTQLFPPAPTRNVPVAAGEALAGLPRDGRVLTGVMLDKVRERAGMSRDDVRRTGYRPGNAYCVMDMTRPAPTITTFFMHPNAGAFAVRSGEEYQCLTARDGAALQSFGAEYIFCGSKTDVQRQIGNAVPPLLAEAVARSLLTEMSSP